MTSYRFGEVVLVAFPLTGKSETKKRPALVILDTGDVDLVLAPITTTERHGLGDYKLKNWAAAGLLKESWIRLGKVASLEKYSIDRRLGELTPEEKTSVAAIWKEVYQF